MLEIPQRSKRFRTRHAWERAIDNFHATIAATDSFRKKPLNSEIKSGSNQVEETTRKMRILLNQFPANSAIVGSGQGNVNPLTHIISDSLGPISERIISQCVHHYSCGPFSIISRGIPLLTRITPISPIFAILSVWGERLGWPLCYRLKKQGIKPQLRILDSDSGTFHRCSADDLYNQGSNVPPMISQHRTLPVVLSIFNCTSMAVASTMYFWLVKPNNPTGPRHEFYRRNGRFSAPKPYSKTICQMTFSIHHDRWGIDLRLNARVFE